MTHTPQPIPVMLTGQALTSLRDSGFSFPAAIGELVDNSVEAKSNCIQIMINESTRNRKKVVDEVVVIDDGGGMDDDTLQHYMQFGFSTRFMSKTTIGKFGVGAKLAGLSVGKRIDAWSRVQESEQIRHVVFDLDDANDAEERGEKANIDPPNDEPLPAHLEPYFPEGSGTLIVWSKIEPDRVVDEYRRSSAPDHVRSELSKELSRMFREFISGGIKIIVDTAELQPHDPTFKRERTWGDRILMETLKREEAEDLPEDGHFPPLVFHDAREPVPGTDQHIRVVITLAPSVAIRPKGSGGDELAKKLRFPENEGAVSFMRLDREISYTNVPKLFPKGVQDKDRYIGFEVYFTPELDRLMGVRNVKRGAEPSEALRETLRKIAAVWIPSARLEVERIWGELDRQTPKPEREHAPVEKAINDATRTMTKNRVKVTPTPAEKQQELEDLAHDVGKETPEEKAEYIEQVKDNPFILETVTMPGDQLILVTHMADQTIIRLNKRHRFFREMYEPLRKLADDTDQGSSQRATARRAIEAITLLLVAYAKAEAQNEHPNDQYGELRTWWGIFTERFMSKIKDVL